MVENTTYRTKICPKMILGHVLVLRHFREHGPRFHENYVLVDLNANSI